MSAGLQFVLAVHDNLLSHFQAGFNQCVTLFDVRDLDWADLDR